MSIRIVLVSIVMLMLAACVSVPVDRGAAQSAELLQAHSSLAGGVKFGASRRDADDLPQEPLDADAAVRVALNRNPHMQALYAQLGLAQADIYDASRLSNPSLSYLRLASGDATRTTWSLTQSFTELLFLNYRTRVGRSQVLQAQQRVAQSVLNLEAQIRTAYYQYLVANLVALLHEQNALAAQASADYAKSLFEAGNVSELQLSREQVAASRAHIELQAKLTDAQQRQSELLTLMGLSLQDSPKFVDRLDVPVEQPLEWATLQRWAEQQRVDLATLREQVALFSTLQTHTRRWFWLSDAQLQIERERDTDGTRLSGLGGSVGLPLFNQGTGSRLRAQAQLEIAQADLATLQLSIGNDVAVQLKALQGARLIVEEYRQRLVPLQERVLELSQQQQNYMLIGALELLNAKREALQAYQDYLNATADFWLKHVALSKTVGGRLPDSAGAASYGISVGVDALPEADADAGAEVGAKVGDRASTADDHAESSHADMQHAEEQP